MPSYIDIAGWIDSISISIAKATPVSDSAPRGQKRSRALADMDVNTTPATPNKKRAPRNNKAVSPIAERDENVGLNQVDDFEDIADTPKPIPPPPATSISALPLNPDAPNFSRPPSTASSSKRGYSEDEDTSQSNRSGQSGSSARKSRRSSSPQKQSSDRQYGIYPVVPIPVTIDNLSILPDTILALARPLRRVAREIAVLPASCNTEAMRDALGEAEDDLFHNYAHQTSVPALETIQDVVDNSISCFTDSVCEAAWNCSVHYPLLELARKSSRHKNILRWNNITSVSISPASLVPELTSQEKLQSRKVDFALSIQLPYDPKWRLNQQNLQVNQTDYGPIKFNPLALSIETKTSGVGRPEASMQVSTWAQAQIRQLRILLQRAGHEQWKHMPIPPLPILFVQGYEWIFWCFEDRRADGVLYEDIVTFGTTTSLLGAYKVVAGLQVLMDWVMEVWWPWIRENILKPLVGEFELEAGLS